MSKILVVGTSHSDGSCKKEDGTDRLDPQFRWQNLIGHDVETIAHSGATSQQQFYALWNYILDNTEATWDYAIVEGRHINSVDGSYPSPSAKNIDKSKFDSDTNYKDFYTFWQNTDQKEKLYAFSSMQNFRHLDWWRSYAMSPLHWVDNYTCIHSMCSLLSERCKDVLFLPWTWNKHHETHKQMVWAGVLLKKYIDFDTWPALTAMGVIPELTNEYECECKHWNEDGQQIIANKVKEIIEKRGWE